MLKSALKQFRNMIYWPWHRSECEELNHVICCTAHLLSQSLASPRQFSSQPEVQFPLGVAGQDYSMTPWLPLSMTPLLTGISVPRVDYSQPEPQNHAFFSDFGSDLQQNGAFWRSKYFLKVVLKLKVHQFTFSELARLGKALQDTGQ
jgi:hypothetical protein